MKKLIFIIISLFCSNFAFANEVEIKLKLGIGELSLSKTTGLHYQPGEVAPAAQSTISVGNNKFKSQSIGIDLNYFLTDNWGVNTEITYSKTLMNPGSMTLIVSNNTRTNSSFPDFEYKGYTFGIGPIYRWNEVVTNLRPYITLNLAAYRGKQNNTKFAAGSAYGVGGPITNVHGWGVIPKLGFDYAIDKNVKIGMEYKYTFMKYTADKFRSLHWGYNTQVNRHELMFNIGYSFE